MECKIIIRSKTGIDENPFLKAMELFEKKKKLRKQQNGESNELLKSSEGGEKSVNISNSSSFSRQKQFRCPVNAMQIRNHDTELHKSDAVAMAAIEQPRKQINSNLPTITSDIPLFDPRRILQRNLIEPLDQPEMTKLKLHKASKEHTNDSFTADTVDTTCRNCDLHIPKKLCSHWRKFYSEHGMDKENDHEEQTESSEKDNEEADADIFLKHPEMMAEEVNKTMRKYYGSHRIPGSGSYVIIAEEVHKRLLIHKIFDKQAIREFIVAFITGEEYCCICNRQKMLYPGIAFLFPDVFINPVGLSVAELKYVVGEMNKTLCEYHGTNRFPGSQSYRTIAKKIHRRLSKHKIFDKQAISEFIVAFVTDKKYCCV